jgi:fructosamine-3-kinase
MMIRDAQKKQTINRSDMFYWQTDRPFDPTETKRIFLDRHRSISNDVLRHAIELGMEASGKTKKEAHVETLHDIISFGSVNIVAQATLGEGTDVVIRAHPPGVPNGYFWVEGLVTKTVKSQGVPTYTTYYIDDSMKIFPFAYMLMEAMPGTVMSTIKDLSPDVDRQLVEHTGELLARIHSVHTQGFGFFNNTIAHREKRLIGIHDVWRDHVFAAYQANIKFLLDTGTIASEDSVKTDRILQGHTDLLNFSDARIIHNDLADWNVRCNGNRITAILDWDESYSGDPIADFSAYSVFFEQPRLDSLKRGYATVTPLPDGFEEKFHYYRIRYIVSKMTTRKQKILGGGKQRYQTMLEYAKKILQDEFRWYGV